MNMPKEPYDGYCGTSYAAKMLGISVGTVQGLVEKNDLKAWKTQGGHRRISLQSIQDYQRRHNLAPASMMQGEDRLRVLVVEDDENTRLMLQANFDQWGLPLDAVHVHTQLIGGAFGRRGEWDYVLEAVDLARRVDAPVKVMWSRADDFKHDFYRPAVANRLAACVDADGRLIAWAHRLAGPSVARRRSPELLARGHDFLLTQGADDMPYAIQNLHVDYHEVDLGVPVGFWRSVGHSHTGVAVECFLDEVARAARRDPLEFRLSMLGDDPRMRLVLEKAASAAGWGRRLPRGRGLGIACMESYGTRVAQVVEVEVRGRKLRVHRVVCVVDCGTVVHPGIVTQQMQGAIVFGLSAALYGGVNIEANAVRNANYDTQPVLRLADTPTIEVHIVPSDAAPGGCGEPATPVIAPALVNAIRAATGRALRQLPLREIFDV